MIKMPCLLMSELIPSWFMSGFQISLASERDWLPSNGSPIRRVSRTPTLWTNSAEPEWKSQTRSTSFADPGLGPEQRRCSQRRLATRTPSTSAQDLRVVSMSVDIEEHATVGRPRGFLGVRVERPLDGALPSLASSSNGGQRHGQRRSKECGDEYD